MRVSGVFTSVSQKFPYKSRCDPKKVSWPKTVAVISMEAISYVVNLILHHKKLCDEVPLQIFDLSDGEFMLSTESHRLLSVM